MAKNKLSFLRKLGKWILRISVVFVFISILWVLLYRWINPPGTILMLSRKIESNKDGFKITKKWVNIENISNNMQLAVICGEDQNFSEHFGFDFKSIERAVEHNKRSKQKVGASTISQQTAKNVFLWSGRSWLRKGLEAWFTLLIELIWSKKRIMEVYLNVIETGDGVFGVEAAARKYFNTTASHLNALQSAKIASILPNPIRFKIGSWFSNSRTQAISYGMRTYGIELKYLK